MSHKMARGLVRSARGSLMYSRTTAAGRVCGFEREAASNPIRTERRVARRREFAPRKDGDGDGRLRRWPVHLRAHLRHGRGGRVQGGRSPRQRPRLAWPPAGGARAPGGVARPGQGVPAAREGGAVPRDHGDRVQSRCVSLEIRLVGVDARVSRGVKPYDRARPSRAPTRMRREMCLFRSCLPRARSDPDPLPRDPSPSPLQKSRSTTPTPSTSARASFARSRRTTSTSAAPRRTRSSATRTFTAPTSSCPRRSGSRTASPSSSPSSVAPTSRWPAATPPPRRSSSTPRAT